MRFDSTARWEGWREQPEPKLRRLQAELLEERAGWKRRKPCPSTETPQCSPPPALEDSKCNRREGTHSTEHTESKVGESPVTGSKEHLKDQHHCQQDAFPKAEGRAVPYPNSCLRNIWLSMDKSDPSDLSNSCVHACTSACFEGDYIFKQGAVTRPALGMQTATLETAPPGPQDFTVCPSSLQADNCPTAESTQRVGDEGFWEESTFNLVPLLRSSQKEDLFQIHFRILAGDRARSSPALCQSPSSSPSIHLQKTAFWWLQRSS
ncbi:uncharacterized protein LOC133221619 [Neopsephotus bourkii]|uniref:uncharacterized protein LOC133221619 n=1 Tax=Neopsephotus bourkii TaxID=309878 RepID=UPI002AA537E9|nr:uncharacterized protein LOC133221619 [Neopsephotus bourkii]